MRSSVEDSLLTRLFEFVVPDIQSIRPLHGHGHIRCPDGLAARNNIFNMEFFMSTAPIFVNPADFLNAVAPTGTVRNVSFNVSGGSLAVKHAGNALIDYSGMTVGSILAYADDNRIISLQRPLRLFSDDELKKHLANPLKIHATACGAKIATDSEKVAALVRAGMPEPLARLSVTDPIKFAALMDAAAGKK